MEEQYLESPLGAHVAQAEDLLVKSCDLANRGYVRDIPWDSFVEFQEFQKEYMVAWEV